LLGGMHWMMRKTTGNNEGGNFGSFVAASSKIYGVAATAAASVAYGCVVENLMLIDWRLEK
jgi:hypothetical protein